MIRVDGEAYKKIKALVNPMGQNTESMVAVEKVVDEILQAVRTEGDKALVRYNQKFAGKGQPWVQEGKNQPLKVEASVMVKALENMDVNLRSAIEKAAIHIRKYHSKQLEQDWMIEDDQGTRLGMLVRPMERVALYIPGGTAAYPSTVLMNVIPAQLAGVKNLYILTPTGPDGEVNSVVLATAQLLGIKDVYRVGGAQAVAAAAYGTATIPRADKIVGPGNKYVATAKKKVFGLMDIDMVAGPSEVMVVADGQANPSFIAADLLAQAEHDADARMILVTTESSLVDRVEAELRRQMASLPRQEILMQSMGEQAWAILTKNLDEAFDAVNNIAPEHLEILVENPEGYLSKIRHAGSVFLGPYAPEAVGDYYAGTNHTLPTGGTARFSSPLGVYDFIKRTAVTSYSAQALCSGGEDIMRMAEAEGLVAHGKSVEIRMKTLSDCRPAETSETEPKRIRLSANENPFGLQNMMSDVWYKSILPELLTNRYPDERYRALRAALSTYTEIDAELLVCGNGSDELIRLAVECFSTASGGGVLTHGPAFGEYAKAAEHKGCKYREVPPGPLLSIDLKALCLEAKKNPPEVIFICTPNNPTGDEASVSEILALCDATKALVVVDEAYYEFGGETLLPEILCRKNLMVLRTLSKAFGMAGLRVGYAAACKPLIDVLNQRRMPYNVNRLAELAAISAIENRHEILAQCRDIQAERERMVQVLKTLPELVVYPSKSNFILLGLPADKRQKVLETVARNGLQIRVYEQHPHLKDCIRVTVGCAEENAVLLKALTTGMEDLAIERIG